MPTVFSVIKTLMNKMLTIIFSFHQWPGCRDNGICHELGGGETRQTASLRNESFLPFDLLCRVTQYLPIRVRHYSAQTWEDCKCFINLPHVLYY